MSTLWSVVALLAVGDAVASAPKAAAVQPKQFRQAVRRSLAYLDAERTANQPK
jgi:hypothetical protein